MTIFFSKGFQGKTVTEEEMSNVLKLSANHFISLKISPFYGQSLPTAINFLLFPLPSSRSGTQGLARSLSSPLSVTHFSPGSLTE